MIQLLNWSTEGNNDPLLDTLTLRRQDPHSQLDWRSLITPGLRCSGTGCKWPWKKAHTHRRGPRRGRVLASSARWKTGWPARTPTAPQQAAPPPAGSTSPAALCSPSAVIHPLGENCEPWSSLSVLTVHHFRVCAQNTPLRTAASLRHTRAVNRPQHLKSKRSTRHPMKRIADVINIRTMARLPDVFVNFYLADIYSADPPPQKKQKTKKDSTTSCLRTSFWSLESWDFLVAGIMRRQVSWRLGEQNRDENGTCQQ